MTDDFNSRRHEFIGGSDVAAIMGLSPWNTPLSVWAKKTRQIEDNVSNIEAVEMGVALEPMVAQLFEKRSGKKVRVETREFTHPDYPYMVAHVDRWVVGEDGAHFEAKTASAYKLKSWQGDDVPEDYQLQCNWYSGIIGLHRGKPPKDCYIGVLVGGQRFIWKKLKFNQELFDIQVEKAKDFWEGYVLTEMPPFAISSDKDTLIELFPESRPDELRALRGEDPELEAMVNQWALESVEGKSQIKEIEVEVDTAENLLRQTIGDDEGIETGQWRATWKSQSKSKFDIVKMREDKVYDKYVIKGTARVLRIVEKKAKQ